MKSTESYIKEDSADKSLAKKSEKSGMPQGVLKQVYNRGVAAWKTGHRPGTTPEQWGHARVNSFITKSSGTWGKADKDLAAKVRKEEVELEENYKITKMYNPTTKKSRTAGKSTATFAVHSHDRKYFKEFPTQKDAQNHMKTLGKNEAEINELDKDTLANYANKAIKDKEDAKYNFNRAVGSKAANRMRGNVQGASDDVKKIKSHSDRIKRRERGAAHFTRKMLSKKKED
jgi:hypothetical protein